MVATHWRGRGDTACYTRWTHDTSDNHKVLHNSFYQQSSTICLSPSQHDVQSNSHEDAGNTRHTVHPFAVKFFDVVKWNTSQRWAYLPRNQYTPKLEVCDHLPPPSVQRVGLVSKIVQIAAKPNTTCKYTQRKQSLKSKQTNKFCDKLRPAPKPVRKNKPHAK